MENGFYLFKIGIIDKSNTSNSILPNQDVINKLKNEIKMLDLDKPCLVWGPELEVEYIGPNSVK